MKFGPLARKYGLVQSRVSPIPSAALLLTFGLGATALVASLANQFVITSLPNILLLVVGAVAIDMISRFAPQSRPVEALRTIAYGLLYLVTTILCGIIAAYAMQRLAFPLQDRFLAAADAALGLSWADFVRWVDGHLGVQRVFHFAYHTIGIQIALPLVVLALSNQLNEVRSYLLAFAIAFIVTIFISALMPAVGPVVFVDRDSFEILKFTGATPVEHLTRLRAAGPLIFTDAPGGIATFPSFHTTVAILAPLTLRLYHRIFIVLLVLDAAMLGGTLTEGAHYYIDVLAGGAMAFFAYSLARRILRVDARIEPAGAALPARFAGGLAGQPEPSQG